MILKNKKIYHLIPAIVFVLFLFFPGIAHAETLQGTLQSNEQIKTLHNGLMNILNIPIILIIVAMAFAEMFRFKIDTYGLKKILPTLLIAIITAQFSYLICKLIIDAANMTILVFLDPKFLGDASGLPKAYSQTFGDTLFSNNTIDWSAFKYETFFNWFLYILFMFAGSIAILVLCFLFLIRSWTIYFLVIISGVAFMLLAFPPTKQYFNKWWSEFFKWAFLPVPSVFFLWFGALFLKNPIVTSSWLPIPFMSAIIAIVCIVAAIAVPFKMGGPIMAKFWQYSGAKWGLDKAKTKWFDPWLDDAKRRGLNWWLSQGSGKQIPASRFNPLGAIVRRGIKIGSVREWRKKETEGWLNQGFREAFGGKLGKDGNLFMSDKQQLKWGKYLDDIDSLFGEKEWKELDLREKYFRTAPGKMATLRSAQYGYRMEGTQQLVDNEKRTARIKALARDDEYMADKHWGRMLDVRNKAKSKNWALEMEERKIEGDMFQTVEGEAYLLDMAVEAYDTWAEELKKKQAELAKATTSEMKRVIQAQIDEINKQLKKAEGSYQETVQKLLSNSRYFDKNKKEFKGLSYMFRDILTDSSGNVQGIEFDDKGNVKKADVAKARRLAEVMGFKQGTTSWNYYNGRRTKRFGIIVKDELASVAGKRTGEDSIFEMMNTDYELEALPKILSGLTGGLVENQIRKTSAELANVFRGVSIQMAQWVPRHLWLTNEVELPNASVTTEQGNIIRANMSQKTKAGLERFANVSMEKSKVESRVNEAWKERIDQALAKKNAELAAQGQDAITKDAFIANDLIKNEEYQADLARQAKDYIADHYGIKGSEVENIFNNNDIVKFGYDAATGRVTVDIDSQAIDDTDAKLKAKMMAIVNTAIINGNSRGSEGEAKNSFNGENDEILAVVKREMGKNQEEFYGYERIKNILAAVAEAERLRSAQNE